jgi:hypothetical protein
MNKKIILAFLFLSFSNIVFGQENELHEAVENNDIKKIDNIIKENPVFLKDFDENGNTPIHKAILEEKSASLEAFMKHKKYINMQITNESNETPLVYAIKNNKHNAVIFILDNGINPFYKDQSGKNSLDYVKLHGDKTTKKIYNSYYSKNKDKILKLQENYKSPLDLSLFEETKKNEDNKIKKTTTVQDLLIANKNKREKEQEEIEESEKIIDVTQKKTEQKIKEPSEEEKKELEELKKKVELANKENEILKRKLQFKQNTGKENLTPLEENVVSSPYAGIYEQQVMFEEDLENATLDLMENYTVLDNYKENKEDLEKNKIIEEVINKTNNYKNNLNDNLKIIEEDIKVIDNEVKKSVKLDNNKDIELLPVNGIPLNQANTEAVNQKSEVINTEVINTEVKKEDNEKIISEIGVKKEDPILLIKKDIKEPEIKVEIKKSSLLKLEEDKILILSIIFLILLLITIILSFIFLKQKNTKK